MWIDKGSRLLCSVAAGMAGFYFIRNFFPEYRPGQRDTGPELPGLPYPPPGGCNQAADVRELPLAIQDRMFKQDGSLWCAHAAHEQSCTVLRAHSQSSGI